MQRPWIGLLAAGALLAASRPPRSAQEAFDQAPTAAAVASSPIPRVERESPSDLELGGDLAGLAPGTIRYLTRDDLLTLPQVSYTVTDDANFTGPTQISGVLLEELNRSLAAAPESDMLVAICSDQYHANYPHAYIAEHHPLLVLKINGQSPAGWPKDPETHRYDMGPYLISHPKFSPAFKIFSQPDEAQIPWGVVRLEFRQENGPGRDRAARAAGRQRTGTGGLWHRAAELLALPQPGTRRRDEGWTPLAGALGLGRGFSKILCRLRAQSAVQESARPDAR